MCLVFFNAAAFAGEGWEVVADENQVKVYARPIKGSDLLEYRGVTVIDERMDTVCEIFSDIDSFPEWMPNCSRIELIKDIDYDLGNDLQKNFRILYIVTDLPWPLTDRDIITKTIIDVDENNGNLVIDVTGVKEPLVPVKEDMVRMTVMKARFIVEYVEEEKTRLIYILSSDPSGSVPHFVVNWGAHENPLQALTGLRKMAKKPKYKNLVKKRKDTAYHKAIARKIDSGLRKSGVIKKQGDR